MLQHITFLVLQSLINIEKLKINAKYFALIKKIYLYLHHQIKQIFINQIKN
jgi:hypothetical protein